MKRIFGKRENRANAFDLSVFAVQFVGLALAVLAMRISYFRCLILFARIAGQTGK